MTAVAFFWVAAVMVLVNQTFSSRYYGVRVRGFVEEKEKESERRMRRFKIEIGTKARL
jgi:hypothetical protein